MRGIALAGFGILFLALTGLPTSAGDKKSKARDLGEPLVVHDAKGKVTRLKSPRFLTGTRRYPLAGGREVPPEFLEFREEKSTAYRDGILTLIPVASLRRIDFNNEKQGVAVTVASASGKDQILVGSTKFVGINKLTVQGEEELAKLGTAAVKFQGGVKGGITRLNFELPQPAAEVRGTVARIIAADKEKTEHVVHEAVPLYLVGGDYLALPYLMFQKTVKVDLDKLDALRRVSAGDKKRAAPVFEVTLSDNTKHNLTLLPKFELENGRKAVLVGIVGQVPVGYKLFPPHTIAELRFQRGEKK